MKIVWIGAGNVATHLSEAFARAGHETLQVFSRTMQSAQILAERLGCDATDRVEDIKPNADVYVLSVKDDVIDELVEKALPHCENALFIHTAGSVPMEVFRSYVRHYGVLYPLQTFSRNKSVDFKQIPLFVEASDDESLCRLRQLASSCSDKIYELSSIKRRQLHLAAVFVCNFVNGCYAMAENILQSKGLPFDVMLPLIDETANKVHTLNPIVAQTGPAARGDVEIMKQQVDLLKDFPEMQEVYQAMSRCIYRMKHDMELNDDL